MTLTSIVLAALVVGTVRDTNTDRPVPARVYLENSHGEALFITNSHPGDSALPYNKVSGLNPAAREQFTTLSSGRWQAELPPGRYRITAERGKEWLPASREFEVSPSETVAPIDLRLRHWIKMAERGWHSGDTHVHRTTEDLPNVILAEDINLVCPMTSWTTVSTVPPSKSPQNMKGTFGRDPVWVDATHAWLPMNTEYEIFRVGAQTHTLGAFVLLNHRSPFDINALPLEPIRAQSVREGALIDVEKHNWPWTFVLLPILQPQLYQLANNHNWRTEFGVRRWGVPAGEWMGLQGSVQVDSERDWIEYGWKTYYGLLNCGYRLMPTASTGHGVHPVPMGFSRVYVQTDGPFTPAAWLNGLRAGRSFITTGPMIEARLDGQPSGRTLSRQGGFSPGMSAEISSVTERVRIEVVRNGEVVSAFSPAMQPIRSGGYRHRFRNLALETPESGWFALRVWEDLPGGRFRFAHTAPWFVTVNSQPIRPGRTEARWFRSRVEEEVERNRAILPAEALQEYERALVEWRRIEAGAR